MVLTRFAVVIVTGTLIAPAATGNHTLTPKEEKSLVTWLADHRAYRLASDEDCECTEDIADMRSGYKGMSAPVPDYHPYRVGGDFNGDGIRDFAVAVVDRLKTKNKFALLVFNGSASPSGLSKPAFFRAGLDLTRIGLFFYGPPPPKPRLVVGAFQSEGVPLVPRGRGYTFAWGQ